MVQTVIAGLLAGGFLFVALGGEAFAQGSLGIGSGEQAIRPQGIFAPVLFWIQQQQQGFYKLLTEAVRTMRDGGSGAWWLAGLSFAYGVFHAAGPGHGKAVISSYMIANEVALRRGIILSFAAAMLQAVTAIAIISAFVLVLRGLGYRSANLVGTLEIVSYAAITLLGAWLLWRKLFAVRHAPIKPVAAGAVHGNGHNHGSGHDEICGDCGHAHAPDPALLKGRFGLREAGSAVLAVGLRPCSGAIIVLTFAFLNGLYFAGIASAFAMAVGTAVTVSALATLAVGAKNLALKVSGSADAAKGFYRAVEIAGAGFVFFIGLTLLTAALYG